MIVLHAAWLTDSSRLAVWAEDGSRPRTASARRGRPPRKPRPTPHPFSLATDGIRLAATEFGGLAAGDLLRDNEAELIVQLPNVGGGPVGSPWLDDELPDAGSGHGVGFARLATLMAPVPSWIAPGFVLEPSDMAPFLSTMLTAAGDEEGSSIAEPSGVALAADFKFAARTAEMVLELTTRGECSRTSSSPAMAGGPVGAH